MTTQGFKGYVTIFGSVVQDTKVLDNVRRAVKGIHRGEIIIGEAFYRPAPGGWRIRLLCGEDVHGFTRKQAIDEAMDHWGEDCAKATGTHDG